MRQTLYKQKDNKILEWTIEVLGDKYRTIAGIKDGNLVTSAYTTCEGKNIGKVNKTFPEDQAIKEALALIKKKKEKGYSETVQKTNIVEVTLAFPIEKHISKIDWSTAYVTPKLDGVRCRAEKNKLYTRNNKDILGVPHIIEALNSFFKHIQDTFLDGELYFHSSYDNFNDIISCVRKSKPTEEDIQKSKVVEFHIFDMYHASLPYIERITLCKNLISTFSESPYLKMVLPEKVSNYDEVEKLQQRYIENSYEGAMLRHGNSGYEFGRTSNLLKVKNFIDEEFEIVNVIEGIGNRSGMFGKFELKTKDELLFEANCLGDFSYYAKLLKDKETLIGKKATVKFQNYTPAGVPRFPIVKTIRNYE